LNRYGPATGSVAWPAPSEKKAWRRFWRNDSLDYGWRNLTPGWQKSLEAPRGATVATAMEQVPGRPFSERTAPELQAYPTLECRAGGDHLYSVAHFEVTICPPETGGWTLRSASHCERAACHDSPAGESTHSRSLSAILTKSGRICTDCARIAGSDAPVAVALETNASTSAAPGARGASEATGCEPPDRLAAATATPECHGGSTTRVLEMSSRGVQDER